jgi:CAAX protease family protein
MSPTTTAQRPTEAPPPPESSGPPAPLAPPAPPRALAQRHPVLAYYALTFAISWGGVALVAGPLGVSGGAALYLGLFLAQAAGPAAAGLVLTGVLDGPAGYRDLLARLTRWRVAPRWYAAALLLNPLALLVVLGGLGLASPAYLPGVLIGDHPLARATGFAAVTPAVLLGLALAVGLASGLFEELGWTGFATPRLLARHGWLAAGLTLGLLWATWHVGPDRPGAAAWGDRWPWRVLLWMFAGMVPYRVLMTWVYRHTRSVLLAVLMHAAYSGGQALLEPGGTGQTQDLLWWGLLGLALGVVAGLVVLADRAHFLWPAPLQQGRVAPSSRQRAGWWGRSHAPRPASLEGNRRGRPPPISGPNDVPAAESCNGGAPPRRDGLVA